MVENKPGVFHVLTKTFKYIFDEFPYFLKIAFIPWLLFGLACSIVYGVRPENAELMRGYPMVIGIGKALLKAQILQVPLLFCALLMAMLGVILFEVQWFKLVLGEEKNQKFSDILQWGKSEWFYTGAALISWSLSSITALIMSYDTSVVKGVALVFALISIRFLFILPSAVLKKSINPLISWRMTEGVSWRLIICTIILGSFLGIIEVVLSLHKVPWLFAMSSIFASALAIGVFAPYYQYQAKKSHKNHSASKN